jgi:hypothetical protein
MNPLPAEEVPRGVLYEALEDSGKGEVHDEEQKRSESTGQV